MLNVPGTLLIARRRAHGSGDPYYIMGLVASDKIEPAAHNRYAQTASVYIPYGDPCMMLSFDNIEKTKSNRKKHLKVLWENKYVDMYVSDKQANAWFTFFPAWKANGHIERFEGFRTDGKLAKLYENLDLKRDVVSVQSWYEKTGSTTTL